MKYAVKFFAVLCVCLGLAFCVGCAGSSPEQSVDTPVVQEAEPVADYVMPSVEPEAVEPEPEAEEAYDSSDVSDEYEAED
ncbi:MAG: hypothetical protein LBU70_06365 [Chitinispirillales bacterium]|jgi:hypothetical protein|nr:hypothetical protein [Chitinispirillales bacterium]